MPPLTLVFDLDGTLVDSARDLMATLNFILRREGTPALPVEKAHSLLGAGACLFVMKGLPIQAWERFGWWLVIGLVLYFAYGFKNSKLRNS